jgi:hypothetical protein
MTGTTVSTDTGLLYDGVRLSDLSYPAQSVAILDHYSGTGSGYGLIGYWMDKRKQAPSEVGACRSYRGCQ